MVKNSLSLFINMNLEHKSNLNTVQQILFILKEAKKKLGLNLMTSDQTNENTSVYQTTITGFSKKGPSQF